MTDSTFIERPIEEVFAFVSDPENDPRWCQLVDELTFTGDRSTGLGTFEFIQVMGSRRVPGSGEIVARVAPERFESRSRFGAISVESSYDLQPLEGSTSFSHTNRVRLAGLMRLLHPILKRNTTRNMGAQLVNLTAILEGR